MFVGAPAQAAKPLFESQEILKLRVEAPFNSLIAAAPHSTAPFDGKLTVLEPKPETLAIQLSPRGISRRNPDNCDFPPLKIEFKEKPGAASLFKGQKSLKLATHCRGDFKYQDYNLLEYAAYKILNVLTPVSFRVRLAEIDYVEAKSGAVRIHRHGFLVEDSHDMAERNGLKEVKVARIEPGQLSPSGAAKSDLFQYLIGNLDWSDFAAVPGTNCCHNIKLLGSAADSPRDLFRSLMTSIPPASSMRPMPTRPPEYRSGPCAPAIFADCASSTRRRPRRRSRSCRIARRCSSAVNDTPALSDSRKKSTIEYLEAFFSDISDPGRLQHQLLDHCRS